MAEFDGPLGAAAVADRGAPARRPDRAARRARRRLPRRARPARGRPARQRQLVRRDRQPADPDQEPGDAAAPAAIRPARRDSADEGTDPEAELRARLHPLPRVPRCRPAPGRGRVATDRAVPARAVGGATRPRWPGRDPPTRRRSTRAVSSGRSTGSPPSPRRPSSPPEVMAADDHDRPSARRSSGRPCATPRRSSSRTCSTGVRDRVVIAVTFLAMLELMKRREIVVEQAAPWGPIVARATTAEERAAAGVTEDADRRPDRRDAGVVRMIDDEAREIEIADRAALERLEAVGGAGGGRAHADRADRGGPRGAAVRRRDGRCPAARSRRSPARTARPSTRVSATSRCRCGTAASACWSTATASSSRRRPRPARWSPATSAPTRSASRRRRSRRWRSSPTASP